MARLVAIFLALALLAIASSALITRGFAVLPETVFPYGLPFLFAAAAFALTSRLRRAPALHATGIAVSVLAAVLLSGPLMVFFLLFGTATGLGSLVAALNLIGNPNAISSRELAGIPILLIMSAAGIAFFAFTAWALRYAFRLSRRG